MRYMILSDIHGSATTLEQALNIYRKKECDMLLLLGDILNYGPRNGLPVGLDAQKVAAMLNSMAGDIVAVRGNCDSEVDQMLLDFHIMDTTSLVVDNGKRLLLTHGHIYNMECLPKGHYDAVFYGHTHLWHLEKKAGTVFCNTGSVTFPKGGNPQTLALYENGVVRILDIDGCELSDIQL